MEHKCGCNSGCGCGCEHTHFELANVDAKVKAAIDKAEHLMKAETGKEYVMIAWEKK